MKKLLLAVLLLTGITSFGQGTTSTERAQEIATRIHALVDSLVSVGWGSGSMAIGNPDSLGGRPASSYALATALATTNSNVASNTTAINLLPKMFNVVSYGADPTFTTDSRAAIQSATNAADAAGGGVVYFPLGHYKLSGAVVTTDGTNSVNNAQVYIPLRAYASSANHNSIKWVGEVEPNRVTDFVDALAPSTKGVILESTLSGSTGCIVGSAYANVSWGNFNYCQFSMENITVRANTKSGGTDVANTITGIDASALALFKAKTVRVDINSNQSSLVQPTSGYGIKLPAINNFALNSLDNTTIEGYYVGHTVTEHTIGHDDYVSTCVYGVEVLGMSHSAYFDRLLIQWCKYPILISGKGYFKISDLDLEDYAGAYGAKWFNISSDITESSNNAARADITYHRVVSGVGEANAGFVNGALSTNLQVRALGDAPPTSSSTFSTPADLASLAFWYRSDTAVTQSGGFISQWDDLSGNGHHLIASGSIKPAVVSSALNGHPAISSDGVDDYMQTAATLGAFSNITVYMVMAQDAGTANNGRLIDCGYSVGFYVGRNGTTNSILGAADAGNAPYGAAQNVTNGTFYTVRMRSDGGTSYLSLNNGTETTYTEAGATITPQKLTLFNSYALIDPGKYKVVEVIGVYDNNVLSIRNNVESYLRTRYAHY